MQLLLEPEDHVPFLQEAVKRFDLLHPADGSPFPSILPKETLPTLPDHEVSQWYDGETQRFMQQARAAAMEELPPRPQKALSDSVASSRDSSISSDSSASTDIAEGHGGPRSQIRSSIPSNNRAQQPPPQYAHVRPCIPERRRSSLPDYVHDYPSPWPRERPKSTSFPAPLRDSRPKHHSREISDSSTISTSTSDSSSRSPSPTPVRRRGQPQPLPTHRRQHSSSFPLQRPASNPQIYTGRPYQPPGASNQRKVRWQDTDNFLKNSPRFPREISRMSRDSAYGYGYANETVDERGRGRAARGVDPYVGVGGRRYQGGPPQR